MSYVGRVQTLSSQRATEAPRSAGGGHELLVVNHDLNGYFRLASLITLPVSCEKKVAQAARFCVNLTGMVITQILHLIYVSDPYDLNILSQSTTDFLATSIKSNSLPSSIWILNSYFP